jgi:prepilin-type N-terminal cleavage/methylation domain-containing protein
MKLSRIESKPFGVGSRRPTHRGFTLVELLLVLVILGTLAAIVILTGRRFLHTLLYSPGVIAASSLYSSAQRAGSSA